MPGWVVNSASMGAVVGGAAPGDDEANAGVAVGLCDISDEHGLQRDRMVW